MREMAAATAADSPPSSPLTEHGSAQGVSARDKVKATLKDGMLEIHLPKTEHAKAETPRKITIE